MELRIQILTEGYAYTGYGHLSRCTAIARAFGAEGERVLFVINGDENASHLVRPFPSVVFNWLEERERLLERLSEADIVIVDSYLADKKLYEAIRSRVKTCVFLDDFNRLDYPEGIVVNGTVGAERIPYRPTHGSLYLLGKDYVILREAFMDLPKEREIKEHIETVLITFGGSDPLNQTSKVLLNLVQLKNDWKKIVILGAAFSKMGEIKVIADERTSLYQDVSAKEMRDLMLKADLAFSAAGQTINELAITGLPAVIFKVADNQDYNIEGWEKVGFIETYLDATKGWKVGDLENVLSGLMDRKQRTFFSRKGREQVDGKGVFRIRKAALRAFHERNLQIRLAEEKDMLPLFELANDPVVRHNSFSTQAIPWEEHVRWMRATLRNETRRLFVCCEGDELVGQVRFDKEGDESVVSVSLSASYRGMGLASVLLVRALSVYREMEKDVSRVLAYVKVENIASQHAFVRAGFRECESDNEQVMRYSYGYGD